MRISIDEIGNIVEMLMGHLKENGYTEVDVEEDYYWVIPKEQRYDPYVVPTCEELGQITMEIESLRRMVDNNQPIGYGLVWLSEILRNIGEKYVE